MKIRSQVVVSLGNARHRVSGDQQRCVAGDFGETNAARLRNNMDDQLIGLAHQVFGYCVLVSEERAKER
jgi:hypothetical protein